MYADKASTATYAQSAGSAATLNGAGSSSFATASHSHSSLDAVDGSPAGVIAVDASGNSRVLRPAEPLVVENLYRNSSISAGNMYQTWIAPHNGTITTVTLSMDPEGINPTVSIRSGDQNGTVLGTTTVAGNSTNLELYDIVFTPPIAVTAGGQYCINMRRPSFPYPRWGVDDNANYPAGIAGFNDEEQPFDYWFQVYMTSSQRNDLYVDNATGYVGLGTTSPSYQLQLSTDSAAKPGTSSWTIASDSRLKNVGQAFTRSLDSLKLIHPIKFNYKQGNALGLPGDQEYVGVLAQDVQAGVPEAVSTDEKGYLHMNTDAVFWTVVNSVKELETENTKLREDNKDLRLENEQLEQRIERIEKAMEAAQ